MGSSANARLRGLSARSAARRCAFLLFGLAALAGTASRASAAVDGGDRAAPSIGRLAEDAGSRATRRARRHGGKRRHYGGSAYRHLAAGTPDHALAMRHAVVYAAAGEAAREWRPHAVHPHRKARRPGTRLASLGHELVLPMSQEQPSLSGMPIRWVASSDCLAMPLRTVLVELAQSFGQLRINSTCRSPRHNARVGGA